LKFYPEIAKVTYYHGDHTQANDEHAYGMKEIGSILIWRKDKHLDKCLKSIGKYIIRIIKMMGNSLETMLYNSKLSNTMNMFFKMVFGIDSRMH
jgi:hypothetical protein